jgi:hypothetical protein
MTTSQHSVLGIAAKPISGDEILLRRERRI